MKWSFLDDERGVSPSGVGYRVLVVSSMTMASGSVSGDVRVATEHREKEQRNLLLRGRRQRGEFEAAGGLRIF